MFAYCLNNPVAFCDYNGDRADEDGLNSRWMIITKNGKTNHGGLNNYYKSINLFLDNKYVCKIFIVTQFEDDLNTIKKENDIVIIDSRSNPNNPSIKIKDSFRISEIEKKVAVCQLMLDYNSNNPSAWNRSLQSMISEWNYHNYMYWLLNGLSEYIDHSYIDRAKDVDLDNNDEFVYYIFRY